MFSQTHWISQIGIIPVKLSHKANAKWTNIHFKGLYRSSQALIEDILFGTELSSNKIYNL